MRAFVLGVTLLAACGGSTNPPDDVDGALDGGSQGDAGVRGRTVRFVMVGDQGTGKSEQWRVAAAVEELCAREGCDFVVTLGDNLYYDGTDNVDDPIWQRAFELPYAGLDLPFHVLLGNHDYGPRGHDVDWAAREVEYTAQSRKWNLPAKHYQFTEGPVGFVMIDTTEFIFADGDGQRDWWPGALAAARQAPWVLGLGHHPYRSNGHEGNAAEYGARFVAFMDDLVCGHVDLYISGHAHDREWFDAPDQCGGTELIVNGASGEVDAFESADTQVRWHDDTRPGFLYVLADDHRFTARFVSGDGTTDFERTLEK